MKYHSYIIIALFVMIAVFGVGYNTQERALWKANDAIQKNEEKNALIIKDQEEQIKELSCLLEALSDSNEKTIAEKDKEIKELNDTVLELKGFIKKHLAESKHSVKASAYTKQGRENGGHYNITSSGKTPKPHHTVAVSRDQKYLMGKKIRIKGVGDVVVEDLMNERWSKKIDLYVDSEAEARRWGVRSVEFIVLPDNETDVSIVNQIGYDRVQLLQ